MDKLKTYVRKNIVFVSILSIFVVIIAGIGVFYIAQNQESKPEEKDPIEQKDPVKKKTSIDSFNGQYHDDGNIQLTWSLSEQSNKIQRLELYHGKNILADVTGLIRYELPLSSYQLSTGVNLFTLKAYLQNGDELKKDVNVVVDYVLDAKNTITSVDGGVLLNFSYKFGNANPVGVPSITFTLGNKGNASGSTVIYQTTNYDKSDSLYTQGTTIYLLDTSKLAEGTYSINLRYFFKDVDESYDFTIEFTVTKPVPPVNGDNSNVNPPADNEPTDQPEDTTTTE